MYGVKQSTTIHYNACGNSTCERFNHTLHDLLKTLDKEQKANWPLHLSSLVFVYNAMPHSVTGYQPYELMFCHKAPTVSNAWLGLAQYNDQYSQSKSAWVNEQHKLILAVNRQALWNIKQTANKIALHAGGSPLDIPKDNLVLLRDHPEGRHKIQDNYKPELFVAVLKHKDPNVYIILPSCGGLVCMVNWQQLFDLKKSSLGDSGDLDPDPTATSSPGTKLPFFQPKKKIEQDRPHNHPYGTRSKTQTKAVFKTPELNEENREEATGWRSLASMFTPWV